MYRIITVHIAFSSVTELLLGLSLLYFFRVFERQMGSGKYGFFVFFVTLLSTIMYVTKLFGSTSLESIIPGPYPIIFSSFVLYLVDIIPRHFITVFRWTVPDKSLVYLGALQLLFSAYPDSLLTSGVGLLCGCIYRWERLGLMRMEITGTIRNVADNVPAIISGSRYRRLDEESFEIPSPNARDTGPSEPIELSEWSDPPSRPPSFTFQNTSTISPHVGRTFGNTSLDTFADIEVPTQMPQTRARDARHAPNYYDEVNLFVERSNIDAMKSMGFSESASLSALSRTKNNLQEAINLLLTG
eukprot:TRINITY_DN9480_c0_g1_i10.p1 TRINITY_DN9480_c0_g1~~TRINITY_DN9480_c0_g1_i10.p1  ORF type:complete len:300 (-),score=26.47 TRINITY_DN9480_c0_g1_i10:334-1233(-)